MACEHRIVAVSYTVAVRQGFDRVAGKWDREMTIEADRAINHIECPECGEDLTGKLHKTIAA